MPEFKRYKDSAIVLRRVDYGEYDRIITFLTKEHGKVGAMVKGVRKPKSRLAGGIELFSDSEIVFLQGKGELDHVVSSRLIKHYRHLLSDYERMRVAYRAIELIEKNTEQEAGSEYYELLVTAFSELDDTSVSLDVIALWFQLRLLRLLGRQPDLENDSRDQPLKADVRYNFDPEEGTFTPQASGGAIEAEHIKAWRLLLGKKPTELVSIRGLAEVAQETVKHLEYMLA